ncbi:PrsW family intramembrane metalloprotease [Vallitalea okinawensis]|uniref:PrsW family intramembrane metalloprotease n=1 Tax=Vallitalea okinawensis TaxID=2078660 RepID=UPI000CFDD011|nr:PrsW family intramembrane metalloprotease [Vallitalea okinawensis]
MEVLELLVVAITPGIALSLALYLADHYDKEPFKYLVIVFILGCFSTFPSVFFEQLIARLNVFQGWLGMMFAAFIVVALVEEYIKRAVVYYSVYHSGAFNEKLDGMIYCSFASLGFATIENIIYVVFRYPYIPGLGWYRAFLSVPTHMLYAITMGYYMSLSKFTDDEKKKRQYKRKSLWIPVILHGVFDLILMVNNPKSTLVFAVFLAYLWIMNIRKLMVFYKDSMMKQKGIE